MGLKVYTSNINYKGKDRLDITVKTGDLDFAPTWDMVMGHKNGTMTDGEYTRRYMDILRISYDKAHDKWLDILSRDEVTFVCYCKTGKLFCHRKILAYIFSRLEDVEYMGER
jgi:uncharacterized protein YeaO (DUF488 family)